MLEERALVIAVHGKKNEKATVRTQRLSACDACQLKSGCGTHSFAKLSGNQSIELDIANPLGARQGDVVLVAIPEQGLMLASLLMYLLPLVSMFMAVLVAQWLGVAGDPGLIGAAAAGLLAGFAVVRKQAARHRADTRFTPRMTSVALQAPPEVPCRQSSA